MDEKRFRELFPEVKERIRSSYDDKMEEERKKFFDHIKMQLKPKNQWNALEHDQLMLRKKVGRRRKITIYSATAAACLILAIVLPNLSNLLKLSEQDSTFVKEQEIKDEKGDPFTASGSFDFDETSENQVGDNLIEHDKNKQEETVQNENVKDDSIQNKDDKKKGKEKESSQIKGEGDKKSLSKETSVNDKKNSLKSDEKKTDTEKVSDPKKESDNDTSSSKENSSNKNDSQKVDSDKNLQNNSQDNLQDDSLTADEKKNSNQGHVDKKDEKDKNVSVHDPTEQTDEIEETIADCATIEDEAVDTNAQLDIAVPDKMPSADDHLDMTVPDIIPSTDSKEDLTEVTEEINDDEELMKEDSTVTAGDDADIDDAIDTTLSNSDMLPDDVIALKEALQGWWSKEHTESGGMDQENITDTTQGSIANDTSSEMQEEVLVEEEVTKEDIEKALTSYSYLYYLIDSDHYGYYHAVGKTQTNISDMEYLGKAVICKEQTKEDQLEDEEKLEVSIYGYPNKFVKIFVRFQVQGIDFYYLYES